MSIATDRELINLVLMGSALAADTFVERFSRFVFWILMHDLHLSREDGEDVFQQVWLHLWEADYRRLRHWRGNGFFASFLAVIVRHLAVDHLRDRPPTRDRPGNPESELEYLTNPGPSGNVADPEELAILEEQRGALREAVVYLSPRDRELIGRKYFRQQTYQGIAGEMGMTVNNVGVALARAEHR